MKRRVWKLVSEIVRRTGANKRGFNRCYTCQKEVHYKKLHAGHFFHNALDLELENLKPQCAGCNLFRRGNLANYAIRLMKDHGPNYLYALQKLAQTIKNDYDRVELERLFVYYKEKLEELG